jgi:hypothetical protein
MQPGARSDYARRFCGNAGPRRAGGQIPAVIHDFGRHVAWLVSTVERHEQRKRDSVTMAPSVRHSDDSDAAFMPSGCVGS